jgi:hypothetical protein
MLCASANPPPQTKEVLPMKILSTRKRVATAAIGLGVVIGSAGVASALSGSPASPVNPNTVATPTTDGADTPPAGDATIGADNSNKDPAHEAAESPDVAAAEAAPVAPRGAAPANAAQQHVPLPPLRTQQSTLSWR